jgi:hypothetical protein
MFSLSAIAMVIVALVAVAALVFSLTRGGG